MQEAMELQELSYHLKKRIRLKYYQTQHHKADKPCYLQTLTAQCIFLVFERLSEPTFHPCMMKSREFVFCYHCCLLQ